MVLAVHVRDVVDDLFAAALLEVDVDIGHLHALGRQESLEQQAVGQRVKRGDVHGVRHDGACGRTAARTHADALAARPLDVYKRQKHIGEEEYWESLPRVQWHMDEPSADPSAVALYFVDQEAAKKVKAVLSGEGADEFFGGYRIYQTPFANAKLPCCLLYTSRVHEQVYHMLDLLDVDLLAAVALDDGQPHEPEAQLPDLVHR